MKVASSTPAKESEVIREKSVQQWPTNNNASCDTRTDSAAVDHLRERISDDVDDDDDCGDAADERTRILELTISPSLTCRNDVGAGELQAKRAPASMTTRSRRQLRERACELSRTRRVTRW